MRYAFHCTGRYGCRKESPSRRRAFLVPREIHARSYRTTSGAEEGRGGIRLGGRTSSGTSSQRNKKWDRVDYPIKRAYIS